jgi:hypothetical protein
MVKILLALYFEKCLRINLSNGSDNCKKEKYPSLSSWMSEKKFIAE